MEKTAKIYVAGHTGLVGSALVRELMRNGYKRTIVRTMEQLDLRNQKDVENFFAYERPEYVFLAAAKVGGIGANINYPADFIDDNLMITANVLRAAHYYQVKKLLFFGSSCIYPRDCPQPIKEEYLLTGALEPTNAPYAVAKIAGITLCQSYNRQYGTNFITCMPTNLYGPYDTFDVDNSHVIPALIVKIAEAHEQDQPEVFLWGTGKPLREFLYVDDCAKAALFLMKSYENAQRIINVGVGKAISIETLAQLIAEQVGYTGIIRFDVTQPDGTPCKLLDSSTINALGWHATVSLHDGIAQTVAWYQLHKKTVNRASLRSNFVVHERSL